MGGLLVSLDIPVSSFYIFVGWLFILLREGGAVFSVLGKGQGQCCRKENVELII